ncbi:MAG: hypothetical protein JOZ62_11060 [Acidobacteriaceae bacterium]|nr:hypothetical protein [Acidobacteriaceae bacterium]
MSPALLIRLKAAGPWAFGARDAGRDQVNSLYGSDSLYSAVTLATGQLGFLPEWLSATAGEESPAAAFTSLFPFQGDTLFAPPPLNLWPPPASVVTTPSPVFFAKMRWSAARFVPLTLIESIVTGQKVLADQWIPDAESGCLLRRDRPSSSPFRVSARTSAAVDRITGRSGAPNTAACIDFEPGAGLWGVVRFRDENAESTWSGRVEAAFRLLGDTGFGGRRRRGWGQTETPEFQRGAWPELLIPKLKRVAERGGDPHSSSEPGLYWLLSLFCPSKADRIDWSGGEYQLRVRGGRVDGSGSDKKKLRMISEASVVAAVVDPVGAAVHTAPDGFPHPAYRSGFAVSVLLPRVETALDQTLVQAPSEVEAPEPKPCPAEQPQQASPDEDAEAGTTSAAIEQLSPAADGQEPDHPPSTEASDEI